MYNQRRNMIQEIISSIVPSCHNQHISDIIYDYYQPNFVFTYELLSFQCMIYHLEHSFCIFECYVIFHEGKFIEISPRSRNSICRFENGKYATSNDDTQELFEVCIQAEDIYIEDSNSIIYQYKIQTIFEQEQFLDYMKTVLSFYDLYKVFEPESCVGFDVKNNRYDRLSLASHDDFSLQIINDYINTFVLACYEQTLSLSNIIF